jgi:diguanylate cyclase (GGDEF)-like protein
MNDNNPSYDELEAALEAAKAEILFAGGEKERLQRELIAERRLRQAAEKLAKKAEKRAKVAEDRAALAGFDPLTGLRNRRGVTERLDEMLRQTLRHNIDAEKKQDAGEKTDIVPLGFAIIAIDIDHFKSVNTAYHHAGGDQALCGVADQMHLQLQRATDLFGRLGGEEFVAVFAEDAGERILKNALLAGERLRARVAGNCYITRYMENGEEKIRLGENGERQLTISIGIAFVSPEELRADGLAAIERAMQKADMALNTAKENGRDCVYYTVDDVIFHRSPYQLDATRAAPEVSASVLKS